MKMRKTLSALHKLQKDINHKNRLLAMYRLFITDICVEHEFEKFMEKLSNQNLEYVEINLSDIEPIVEAMNEDLGE